MLTRDIIESNVPTPDEAWDVLVAGGGPAGIGAALAAAASGAKTLLLEAKAFFGGVAAVSGWMPMNRLFTDGHSRGGAVGLFTEKIKSLGPDASREGKVSWVDGDGLHIHPDYLRLAVMELLEEQNCRYLLDSPVTGAEMDAGRIRGAVCDGKYGRRVYRAKVYVDCSGDGDLAYFAGAPMQKKGREEDGMFMPVTMGFVIANVDEKRLYAALADDSQSVYGPLREAANEGFVTSSFYSFDRTTVPGVVSVNNGGPLGIGVIDATDIGHVNIAERAGLQVAIDFIRIAREKKLPGLKDARLVRTGAALGVRETRRIQGEYVMTLEDAQKGVEFADTVARRYGTIDPGGLKESQSYHGSIQSGHAYPYRCMLPKAIDPLLVAGRCASLTHLGLATCKSMGNMMAIGQAAGVAAALCSRNGTDPRDADVGAVQAALCEMNVAL